MPRELSREEFLVDFMDRFKKPPVVESDDDEGESYDQEQLSADVIALIVQSQEIAQIFAAFSYDIYKKDIAFPISQLERIEKIRKASYHLENLLNNRFRINQNTVEHLKPKSTFAM